MKRKIIKISGMSLVEISIAMAISTLVVLSVGSSVSIVTKNFKERLITSSKNELKNQLKQVLISQNLCSSVMSLPYGFNPGVNTSYPVPIVTIPSANPIALRVGSALPGDSGLVVRSMNFIKDYGTYVNPTTGISGSYVESNYEYYPIKGTLTVVLQNTAVTQGLVAGQAQLTVAVDSNLMMKRSLSLSNWTVAKCGGSEAKPVATTQKTGWTNIDITSNTGICSTVSVLVNKDPNPAIPSSGGVGLCPPGSYLAGLRENDLSSPAYTDVNNCRCVDDGSKGDCGGYCFNECDPYTGNPGTILSNNCDSGCSPEAHCGSTRAGATYISKSTSYICCKVKQ